MSEFNGADEAFVMWLRAKQQGVRLPNPVNDFSPKVSVYFDKLAHAHEIYEEFVRDRNRARESLVERTTPRDVTYKDTLQLLQRESREVPGQTGNSGNSGD